MRTGPKPPNYEENTGKEMEQIGVTAAHINPHFTLILLSVLDQLFFLLYLSSPSFSLFFGKKKRNNS
jgi:hypothetical protein